MNLGFKILFFVMWLWTLVMFVAIGFAIAVSYQEMGVLDWFSLGVSALGNGFYSFMCVRSIVED